MKKIFNELLSDSTKTIEKEMIDAYKGEYYDLFKSIFDDAENGIYIVDYDGNIVEMNNLFAEMFGYDKSELINEHYSILISEDSRPVVNRNHYKIFNGINILKAEEKVRHKNGTYFYIQTSNLRVNDELGNSLRITTAVDITARLKKELVQSVLLKISNLANLNINFEKLFPSIHDAVSELIPIKNFAVCVKNRRTGDIDIPYNLSEKNDNRTSLIKEHRYIEKERKATILDEYKIEKLVDEGILANYETIPKIFLGTPLITNKQIMGSLIVKNYNGLHYTKDDRELLELVAGQVARVIERKNYEEDLVHAKNEAEEAVKLKSEFLAQISHEIRTPLNSILSFSSLIKNELNGTLTPELEETFKYIERGGNRLTRTIDLILNVSKSQNNQYKIRLEEIDLTEDVLIPILREFGSAAKSKNIELGLEQSTKSIKLVCDQYSVNQLFSNLLENALKYTKEGRVTIKAFQNELGKIQVDVKDTGIGISDEYLPKLFDPFSQEEQGYTRTYEGIGLGLSLVKSYADLNNAEIKVESKKDKGTIFSVVFN